MFRTIYAAGVHPLYVRLLLHIYRNQSGQVYWEGNLSVKFLIRNGVRQGAVLSPILFNLYTTELFKILEDAGDGCRINGSYFGLFGYADDLALLCNTISGMQRMLNITSDFAEKHNIKFSTNCIISKSKTKCIAFGLKKEEYPMSNMILNKKPLPWVDTVKYLGCQVSNSREILGGDIMAKRARFIDNVHACMQEFKWAHPSILSRINKIYNCNIYGANLYALDSGNLRKLVNNYSVAMKTQECLINLKKTHLI